MQGRLRNEPLTCVVRSECAGSGEPIEIEIDSALNCRVLAGGPQPLVFAPMVDFERLADPSIIDAF